MGLQRGIVGAEKELVREWFGKSSEKTWKWTEKAYESVCLKANDKIK